MVLTANDVEGRPHGMTVNSLTSVSLVPPLLLVCIDHQATMHDILLAERRFAANMLSAPQEALARRFAGKHDHRFDGIGYRLSESGLVLLDGALAHLECEREVVHPAGDHSVIVARVVGGRAVDGRPLLYYRGGYAVLG